MLLQILQVRGSDEPQSPQKLSPLPTSAPQRGQNVRSCSMMAVVTYSCSQFEELTRPRLIRRYRHLLRRIASYWPTATWPAATRA